MTDIKVKIKTTYTPDINVVTIKSDSKVEDIMKEIEKYSGIAPASQKLIFKGKILKPEEPISTYKIENESTIIMVKTMAPSQSQSSQQPVSAPSNNVSSNPEENITIKVKTNLDATVHNITINKNATVLGLKGEIEKATHVTPAQQKLIIKGRTMQDSDPISTYELNNDSIVAMVKTSGQSQPPRMGPGLGGIPGLGGLNPGQMGQGMNEQMEQQALNEVLNNPEMLNQVLNSPELRPLFEQNPQLREILRNPQARQLLLGTLGRGGGNPLGGLGGLGGLGNLRPSSTPNTRLGELFTQWMDNEKSGQPQPQRPVQPRVPGTGAGGPPVNPQPVFQQFPQPDPNVDYKEKYKDQIAQIKEMGIDDEEKIIDALKKCDGNVQYALNRLFS